MEINLVAKRETDKEVINGIEFRVAVSPYFFPSMLECKYDNDSGQLVIDFKYLIGDDEPTESQGVPDPSVKVLVGKTTRRIQCVLVEVDSHDIDQVELFVTDSVATALDSLRSSAPGLQQNFIAAKSAFADHGSEIAKLVSTV